MDTYRLGTAIRWASLMPNGFCPPARPDLHAFLGYIDEQVLRLERPNVPGHFTDTVRAALLQAGYQPRQSFERFHGSYEPRGPIVLSPYTALRTKDWPICAWKALERSLTRQGYVCEWESTGTLWELENQLRRASMVIGADSGPLHLADYMGIPVLGLFGVTRPQFHGPIGPRAHVIHNPLGCSRISVEAVENKVRHIHPRDP